MNTTRFITGRHFAGPGLNRCYRAGVLLVVLAFVQCLLLGSLLTGEKLMIGLSLLKLQNPAMLTPVPAGEPAEKVSMTVLDPVMQFEPFRKFIVDEYKSGRLPLWNRYSYCGSPFLANAQSAIFSPYRLIDLAMDDPISWAWVQFAKGIIAGLGMYLFLRVSVRTRFIPALLAAQLFPLAGFMLYYHGHPHTQAASWLPWVVLGVDRLVRRPGPGWLTLTVFAGTACFFSGHPQTTLHVYILAGLWAVGLLAITGYKRPVVRTVSRAAWLALAGVLLTLLCGPQLFPTLEYLPYSTRLDNRAAGLSASPVSGINGLMQMLYPYFSGSAKLETVENYNVANHAESVASASIGMVWVLVFAPLGLMLARRDKRVWLLAAIVLFGLAYNVGIPLINLMFEHGPLSMLSPNRFVLLTAFALTCLGAIGFDRLTRRQVLPKSAWWPGVLLAACAVVVLAWCLLMAQEAAVDTSLSLQRRQDAAWFTTVYTLGVIATSLLLACLVLMWLNPALRKPLAIGLGIASVAEVVVLAWGIFPAAPRASYYPAIPALHWVHQQTGIESRATGFLCFGANLNMIYQIPDPRGYDALDPSPIVQLLETSRNGNYPRLDPDFALVMGWTPRPSPVVDMLAVRYLILRGAPAEKPAPVFVGYDYYILENTTALPRVYVPKNSVVVPQPKQRLEMMSSRGFSAAQTLVLDEPAPHLPTEPMLGTAKLISDTGSTIKISADMQTPGVVVLADMWYPGWKATYTTHSPTGSAGNIPANTPANSPASSAASSTASSTGASQHADILKVNHALKAIALPAGQHTVTLVYWPQSFVNGLYAAGLSIIGLAVVWGCFLIGRKRA